jgi:hypothetical protein
LKHKFQWNITNPTYRKLKHFNCHLRLLIFTSTTKAFHFLSSFDSCVFWLIKSTHLDRSFCLFQDVIMYVTRQPFFQSSNITIVFNGNWYEHNHIWACLSSFQTSCSRFSNKFHHVSRGFLGFETCTTYTNRKLTLLSFVPNVTWIVTTF